jgi:hypothetical protein
MADRMLPYDTGGYKFPFYFAVAPRTENSSLVYLHKPAKLIPVMVS